LSETTEVRIGQMSDLHLGYRQYGKFERVKDFYSAAVKAAEVIIEQKPDLVIVAGDIFHKSLPYFTSEELQGERHPSGFH
jgi:exonuclease SbcD